MFRPPLLGPKTLTTRTGEHNSSKNTPKKKTKKAKAKITKNKNKQKRKSNHEQKCTLLLVFWSCTLVTLSIVLWATHGLPLWASVYRGCLCWDPPMCLDAQGGIKGKVQNLCGCWSVLLMFRGGPNKVNVIAAFCSCTCFVFDNNS